MIEKRLSGKERRKFRARYHTLKVTAWIGKQGLRKEVIKHLDRMLREHEVIKVRVLRNLLKREDIVSVAEKLNKLLQVEIVDIRGHTLLLYRPKTGWKKHLKV